MPKEQLLYSETSGVTNRKIWRTSLLLSGAFLGSVFFGSALFAGILLLFPILIISFGMQKLLITPSGISIYFSPIKLRLQYIPWSQIEDSYEKKFLSKFSLRKLLSGHTTELSFRTTDGKQHWLTTDFPDTIEEICRNIQDEKVS